MAAERNRVVFRKMNDQEFRQLLHGDQLADVQERSGGKTAWYSIGFIFGYKLRHSWSKLLLSYVNVCSQGDEKDESPVSEIATGTFGCCYLFSATCLRNSITCQKWVMSWRRWWEIKFHASELVTWTSSHATMECEDWRLTFEDEFCKCRKGLCRMGFPQ